VTWSRDSSAVLAWLDGEEPAAEIVRAALDSGRPAISWINHVEIEYLVGREHGAEVAETVLRRLR
jgi:hypothetical protein